MTGASTTTSLGSVFDVDWDRDVVKTPVECPRCGRTATRLDILPWGISPIACDFCADEWERDERAAASRERSSAFAASGVPDWAASLEPDEEGLDAFLRDMGARGVRALWIQRDDPEQATRAACAILRAWMGRRTERDAFQSGAYAMETAVYSRDGIGQAARAGMLVIDGFGRRSPSRYEAGRLRELVEARRVGRLPIVIASTLGVGKAGDVIGRSCGEGVAAMESIVSMMRGLS